ALSSVKLQDNGETIVNLEGISFLISYSDQESGKAVLSQIYEVARKATVMRLLKEAGLTSTPACGLMIVKQEGDKDLYADPYVYVRDTGTLYYESGCGSGSTSIGLMLAVQQGQPVVAQKIMQPSGMALTVTVDRDKSQFLRALVNGPIAIPFDARMYLPKRVIDGRGPKIGGIEN
ncbi:MAG: hypothetical protein KKA05_03105, partial [Alphaproteobacteria bacterium]|nr:hypothetical protein [Alphaproteobacteria bacterium]